MATARSIQVATNRLGQLEVRLGAGGWYWATQIELDDDPVKAARAVAKAEKYFPTSIWSRLHPKGALKSMSSGCLAADVSGELCRAAFALFFRRFLPKAA